MVNFCAAILILKMEEDTQHFWHIILCYFKKGKNTTEMQKKKFVQYMGKVLWLIKRVKSGLWWFSLGDAPQLGRPTEVDSDEVKTLIENNQHYTM